MALTEDARPRVADLPGQTIVHSRNEATVEEAGHAGLQQIV